MPEFDGMRERVVAIEQGMWQAQQEAQVSSGPGGGCSISIAIYVFETDDPSGPPGGPIEDVLVRLEAQFPPYDVWEDLTDPSGYVLFESDSFVFNGGYILSATKTGYGVEIYSVDGGGGETLGVGFVACNSDIEVNIMKIPE